MNMVVSIFDRLNVFADCVEAWAPNVGHYRLPITNQNVRRVYHMNEDELRELIRDSQIGPVGDLVDELKLCTDVSLAVDLGCMIDVLFEQSKDFDELCEKSEEEMKRDSDRDNDDVVAEYVSLEWGPGRDKLKDLAGRLVKHLRRIATLQQADETMLERDREASSSRRTRQPLSKKKREEDLNKLHRLLNSKPGIAIRDISNTIGRSVGWISKTDHWQAHMNVRKQLEEYLAHYTDASVDDVAQKLNLPLEKVKQLPEWNRRNSPGKPPRKVPLTNALVDNVDEHGRIGRAISTTHRSGDGELDRLVREQEADYDPSPVDKSPGAHSPRADRRL